MKFITLLLSIAFCGLCFLQSDTFAQDKKPIRQSRATIRGESYAYKISSQDFANTPSWNPEQGEPPFSISQAIRIAQANLPRFVKNSETWKIRQVHLQKLGEDKWFYQIYFLCYGVECREIEERSFAAIVKMDGTILEPKRVIIEN